MWDKRKIVFLLLCTLAVSAIYGQSSSSLYLFHWNPFKQVQPQVTTNKRRPKTRTDFGVVFPFYSNDANYTNTTQSKGGYTIGVLEEIPVMHKAAILFGAEFYKSGLAFNSYFFAKGYSFLYIPADEIYNHTLSINEFQFPVEYKFSFTPETKNIRTFYGLFGWMYRLLIYDNATVIDTQNGKFIFEGQNNLEYKYNLFTKDGSTGMVFGLGFQRNGLKNGNAFFLEIDYKYGISPIIYSGNNMGSNNVLFTMNTLTFKLGLKL